MLPLYWRWSLGADLRKRDLTALPVLRCLLISSVAALIPTANLWAKPAADAVIYVAYNNNVDDASRAAEGAALAVFHAAEAAAAVKEHAATAAEAAAHDQAADAESNAALIYGHAVVVYSSASNSTFQSVKSVALSTSSADAGLRAVRHDCLALSRGQDVFAQRLWPEESRFAEEWDDIKQALATGGTDPTPEDDWRFWLAWYDHALNPQGQPPNWTMLEEIALIDANIWDAGPKEALPVINAIWERYQLVGEAIDLREAFSSVRSANASAIQRSHNNPPELLDASQPVAHAVSSVAQSLDETIEGLSNPSPDKTRLAKIAHEMLAALKAIGSYCGKVLDTVTMAGAQAVGTGSGVYIVDHYLLSGRLLEFAHRLLQYSSGP
ncbi:MAG: hypothetical protein ACKVKF_21560 [Rhodobacterales bacterium]